MISHYGIFCKVIESRSFTRAAAEIGYSQSAVSQTVKALEQELGTALVYREKNGITLTGDGESYYPYFLQICRAEEALEQKYDEMQGLSGNTIRIAAFASISRFVLPPVIRDFKEKYPKVRFQIRQGSGDDIIRWIKNREVDFGFVTQKAVNGLDLSRLFQQRLLAVFPKTHPFARKTVVTLQELAEEPMIIPEEGSFSMILQVFQRSGLQPDIEFQVYDDDSILAMLEQGLGVAVMVQTLLNRLSPDLTTCEIEGSPARDISLAWHNRETMSLASRRFMKFLLDRPEFAGTKK